MTVRSVTALLAASVLAVSLAPLTAQATPDTALSWVSGGSGDEVADGSFGDWRGRASRVASTWSDTGTEAMLEQWSIAPSGPLGDWEGKIDHAIGAFNADESWARAARGDYDSRWTQALKTMRDYRSGRGVTFIRFAHEMNGNWFDWSVHPGEEDDFVTAFKRFSDLAEVHFPRAKIVWAPNDGTTTGIDVRDLWPGKAWADVIGVDSYNAWPHVPDVTFSTKINATGQFGDPVGIQKWLEFARAKGVPMSLPEWANSANDGGGGGGDAPAYMQGMYDWLTANGGLNEPGKVWYEAYFNIGGYGPGNQHQIYPTTDAPNAAAKYRALWSR